MMKKRTQSSARRFQAMVAELLQLSGNASELTVKNALRAKGAGFVEWYEARQRAIAEAEKQVREQPTVARTQARSSLSSDPTARSKVRRRTYARRIKLDP
jgi:hypothetical protein